MGIRLKLTVLLFYVTGFCVSQNYNTKLFSKDQGLPDPYVYSVVQDKAGYLWVSTGKGLVKFDGQFFSKINTDSLKEEIVYASAVEKSGTLWFGTSAGKLFSWDPAAKKLNRFSKGFKASVKTILSSEHGDYLLITTVGNGIFVKRGDDLLKIEGSADYQINNILELGLSHFLISTVEGLFILETKTLSFTKVKGNSGDMKEILLLEKENNKASIFSSTGFIFEIRIGELPEIKLDSPLVNFGNGSSGEIKRTAFSRPENSLFLATANGRLSIYNLQEQKEYLINEMAFSASVNSFFADDEQNIWIATVGKGLYRLTKTDYEATFLNEPVFSMTQDLAGNNYYGTKEGVKIYGSSGKQSKKVDKLKGKPLGKINALYHNGKYLWIGTEENGLSVVNLKNFEPAALEFSKIGNLSVNSITGKDETVIVTTNLEGAYIYTNNALREHFSVENSLLHNNVYYALRNKKGKIFYATHNTSFNYSEGKQLFEIDTKGLGLIADFNGFAEGKEGELFIATNGDGIYELKDGAIKPCDFNGELDSKFCDGVLIDNENNLWIIQRYNLYKYYTKEKILREIKLAEKRELFFNPNAFYKSESGELFFGTNNGVVYFNGNRRKDRLVIPYLVTLSVQDSLLRNTSDNYFAYGSYGVFFEFSALGLKNSEAVLFKYMLEGRDEHWSDWSSSRTAEFSKLGEGDYAFKVIASNSEGFFSEPVTLYHFSISAPYWKKPFFWIVLIVFLIAFVFLVLKMRTGKLMKDKELLEGLVTEKTKELRAEKELVEKSNIRIEEQNREIKDSITYAKRIQEALLPDRELLITRDKNIFVLFQPRNIVSGDFYWVAEINGLKIIAAADCTGHGVPGALMSMIGTTLLNKIILEKKITRPKEILKELDGEIKQALRQHTADATRDGMDMCLCCLDRTSKKLAYAGAMRPLFLVRDRQLTEYNPTKQAIGGFSYGKEKEFEETEIALKANDMFYLFSDGYADQFGGEKGKKLMAKNFKKILSSIAETDLHKQEENLKRVYNNWKGDLDQVDDMLIIGVRM